jgi:hypothetical protein
MFVEIVDEFLVMLTSIPINSSDSNWGRGHPGLISIENIGIPLYLYLYDSLSFLSD